MRWLRLPKTGVQPRVDDVNPLSNELKRGGELIKTLLQINTRGTFIAERTDEVFTHGATSNDFLGELRIKRTVSLTKHVGDVTHVIQYSRASSVRSSPPTWRESYEEQTQHRAKKRNKHRLSPPESQGHLQRRNQARPRLLGTSNKKFKTSTRSRESILYVIEPARDHNRKSAELTSSFFTISPCSARRKGPTTVRAEQNGVTNQTKPQPGLRTKATKPSVLGTLVPPHLRVCTNITNIGRHAGARRKQGDLKNRHKPTKNATHNSRGENARV